MRSDCEYVKRTRYASREKSCLLRPRASRLRSSHDLYFRLPEFPLIPARRLLSRLVYLRCPAQIISAALPPRPPRRLVRVEGAFHCYTRRLRPRLRLRLALCRLASYNSSSYSSPGSEGTRYSERGCDPRRPQLTVAARPNFTHSRGRRGRRSGGIYRVMKREKVVNVKVGRDGY